MPDGSATGGFILRTNAEDASDTELAEDTNYLRTTFSIRERNFKAAPGSLLHQDLSLVQRVLRDLSNDATPIGAHRLQAAT